MLALACAVLIAAHLHVPSKNAVHRSSAQATTHVMSQNKAKEAGQSLHELVDSEKLEPAPMVGCCQLAPFQALLRAYAAGSPACMHDTWLAYITDTQVQQ